MANVDTENKRRSVGGYVLAWLSPRPDGTIQPGDRRHVAWIYRAPVLADEIGSIDGILGLDSAQEQVYDEIGLLSGFAGLDSPVVNVYDELGLVEGIVGIDSPVAQGYAEAGTLAGILELSSPDEFVFGNVHFPYNTRANYTPELLRPGGMRLTESSAVITTSNENKRRSVGAYALSAIAPRPDGSVGAPDRRQVAWLYPGPFVGSQGTLLGTSIRARQDDAPFPGRIRVVA